MTSKALTGNIRVPGSKLAEDFGAMAGLRHAEASDSSTLATANFYTWCDDLGYQEDSRKAERTYKAIQHADARLKRFLGTDLYETLLYHTEPL